MTTFGSPREGLPQPRIPRAVRSSQPSQAQAASQEPRTAVEEAGPGARPLRAVAKSVVAQAAALPFIAFTVMAQAHIVVTTAGVSGYALYALVTTLPTMLPIGDLGTSAAIVDGIARARSGDRALVRRTLLSAARNLLYAGALIALAGVALALLGVWDLLLGEAARPGADLCMAVTAVLFACSLPLGLGKSVLAAVGRNHVAQLLQAGASGLALALVLIASASGAPLAVYVAAWFLALCLSRAFGLLLASRHLRMSIVRVIVDSVCARDREDRAPIGHLAVPMTAISMASAVAFATDRLVLSHTADATAVAAYSAGAQLFTPVVSVVNAAGMPLWVMFAHRRQSAGQARRDLVRLTVCFGIASLIIGAGLVLLGPTVASWVVDSRITVGADLMAAFAGLVFVLGLACPATTVLTDAAGLRFQATALSLMAVVNLAVSIPLAHYGAVGPVIGSAVTHGAIVLVPTLRKAFSSE